jgi:hypothetical protein
LPTVNDWVESEDVAYVWSPPKLAVILYGLPAGESCGVAEQLAVPDPSVVAEQLSLPKLKLTVSPDTAAPEMLLVSVALSVAGSL